MTRRASTDRTGGGYPFDARPLTDPVTRSAVRAHRKSVTAAGQGGYPEVAFIIGGGALVLATMIFGGVFLATLAERGAEGWVFIVACAAIIAVIIAIVVAIRHLIVRGEERGYRLDSFARQNGMQWLPRVTNPSLPGMIFGIGQSRYAIDVMRGDDPRYVEIGNYRFVTGSGKNRATHRWGYVGVRLSSPLPHIVLDARSNNMVFGASNLPKSFDKSQQLELEGDFGRHFKLYCPEGYERDALYLFTPDIMARFVDTIADLDVEIVDDWLFLYAKRDFATHDPDMWAYLFSVTSALVDKFAQWERWRDDQLNAAEETRHESLPFAAPHAHLRPPTGVATRGKRLTDRTPWVFVGIVLTGVVASIVALIVTGVANQ